LQLLGRQALRAQACKLLSNESLKGNDGEQITREKANVPD
jgi:hypothetical protein